MDKAEMVVEEKKKSYKKMSVIANEKDFIDVIDSLKYLCRPIKGFTFKLKHIRWVYSEEVKHAHKGFTKRLYKARDEFPLHGESFSAYHDTLRQGFDSDHLGIALQQLTYATILLNAIVCSFQRLLKKDDCDSLVKCRRLKVCALGSMYTIAMRCLPSLAYLEKVRQHMVEVESTDKNLEDENTASLTNDAFLAYEDCTVPDDLYGFDFQKVDGFVHPETMTWLLELEQEHGLNLQDEEGDDAKLARKLRKQLALPLSA